MNMQHINYAVYSVQSNITMNMQHINYSVNSVQLLCTVQYYNEHAT